MRRCLDMKQTNDGAKPKKDSKLTYVKELTNTPNALDVIESKYQDIINKVNSLLIQEMLFEVAVLTDEEQDLKMDVLGTSRNQVSLDRKSTRLNSSHVAISYAVFCLKKKIHNYEV